MSKPARAEDAYVVHIMLRPVPKMQLWYNGRVNEVPPLQKGSILIAYLEEEPAATYYSAFDFLRLYVAKATIDELSDNTFGSLPEGLRRPDFGTTDATLHHLALAVAELLDHRSPGDQLVLDQLALAFNAHITQTYAGAPLGKRPAVPGRLAPWQEKRAKDYFEANLASPISLLEVARVCGLSSSHFARAFRAATGRPPHRWLIERRVEAAKVALKNSDRPLSEISQHCGFSDPSHFSRVFSRTTGEAPAAWRRSHGRT